MSPARGSVVGLSQPDHRDRDTATARDRSEDMLLSRGLSPLAQTWEKASACRQAWSSSVPESLSSLLCSSPSTMIQLLTGYKGIAMAFFPTLSESEGIWVSEEEVNKCLCSQATLDHPRRDSGSINKQPNCSGFFCCCCVVVEAGGCSRLLRLRRPPCNSLASSVFHFYTEFTE